MPSGKRKSDSDLGTEDSDKKKKTEEGASDQDQEADPFGSTLYAQLRRENGSLEEQVAALEKEKSDLEKRLCQNTIGAEAHKEHMVLVERVKESRHDRSMHVIGRPDGDCEANQRMVRKLSTEDLQQLAVTFSDQIYHLEERLLDFSKALIMERQEREMSMSMSMSGVFAPRVSPNPSQLGPDTISTPAAAAAAASAAPQQLLPVGGGGIGALTLSGSAAASVGAGIGAGTGAGARAGIVGATATGGGGIVGGGTSTAAKKTNLSVSSSTPAAAAAAASAAPQQLLPVGGGGIGALTLSGSAAASVGAGIGAGTGAGARAGIVGATATGGGGIVGGGTSTAAKKTNLSVSSSTPAAAAAAASAAPQQLLPVGGGGIGALTLSGSAAASVGAGIGAGTGAGARAGIVGGGTSTAAKKTNLSVSSAIVASIPRDVSNVISQYGPDDMQRNKKFLTYLHHKSRNVTAMSSLKAWKLLMNLVGDNPVHHHEMSNGDTKYLFRSSLYWAVCGDIGHPAEKEDVGFIPDSKTFFDKFFKEECQKKYRKGHDYFVSVDGGEHSLAVYLKKIGLNEHLQKNKAQ